jgi:D-amino-acid oxidase
VDVTVVGAGVSGLTTANVFQCAGHRVSVVADRPGMEACSGAAGAIWLPYHLEEGSRKARRALHSYSILRDLAETTPEAGVDMLYTCEAVDAVGRPWWADHVVDAQEVDFAGIRGEARREWALIAPRIEPAIYVPWLESQLGRPIEWRTVASFDELPGDLVVNCAGMGALSLAGDEALTPVFGQTVIVEPGTLSLGSVLSDERTPPAIWYAIPRRSEVVLGGCRTEVEPGWENREDEALTAAILERTGVAGFVPGKVLRVRTGIRPLLPEPRVEREGRIVHNYGHGGSGFALSWGCAQAALDLAGG